MRREAKGRGTPKAGAKTVQQRVDYRKAVLVGQTNNISFLNCGSLEALFGDHARPQATSDPSLTGPPDTARGPEKHLICEKVFLVRKEGWFTCMNRL